MSQHRADDSRAPRFIRRHRGASGFFFFAISSGLPQRISLFKPLSSWRLIPFFFAFLL
jgi:hypothetical protein